MKLPKNIKSLLHGLALESSGGVLSDGTIIIMIYSRVCLLMDLFSNT
jgi:hypothetical protein